jgi:hypothetical protein
MPRRIYSVQKSAAHKIYLCSSERRKVLKPMVALSLIIMAAIAPVKSATAYTISSMDQGGQISAVDTAEVYYYDGRWHMIDSFSIGSDAGDYGPACAVFDLASISVPVTSAVLNLQITAVHGPEDLSDYYPVALYDVSDSGILYPPANWQSWDLDTYMADFWNDKADLTSGAVYGEFMAAYGATDVYLEIALTSAAINDINASLGDPFAIGFGPSSIANEYFFPDEGASVFFGSAELTLTSVPVPCTILLLGSGLLFVGAIRRFLLCIIKPSKLLSALS